MKNGKKVLISGASFAGLSTAYWMSKFGYDVTVVETANGLRTGGTAVNIEGRTLDVVERMGILEPIRTDRLNLELWEYKNADDVTEGSMVKRQAGEQPRRMIVGVEKELHGLHDDRVERPAAARCRPGAAGRIRSHGWIFTS